MRISTVIPSCGRNWSELITLEHLASQNRRPDEVIVVMDGESDGVETGRFKGLDVVICHTTTRGAAAKRNLGISQTSEGSILLADDDIEPGPNCIAAMEAALNGDPSIGGVGCFIENQRFAEPGIYSRTVWRLTGAKGFDDFSGRCFGPMITTYPRHLPDGPATQEVEWLNSGFTLYRRKALPEPPFDGYFTGYSFMEDVALSRRVKRTHKLVVAKDAWIIHHVRPAPYRDNAAILAEQGVQNKHYILTQIEGWSHGRAARACLWYELLMLPSRAVQGLRYPSSRLSLVGTAKGLVKLWR